MAATSRVAHLTSAHPRHDTRIFLKQCRSLAATGYETHLVVADGGGDELRDGVQIVDVGAANGRRDRAVGATRRVLKRAIELDADIYHFHDPELLPIGLALKRRRKRVIYDSHEDLPRDILSKAYISAIARHPIAVTADLFERFASRRFDAVVAATPVIRDKFHAFGAMAVDVNNFPMLGELDMASTAHPKAAEVCYVGGIATVRGIKEIVVAMALCRSQGRLNLAGTFDEAGLKDEVEKVPGWDRVNELGYLSRSQVRDVLHRSVAGLVTLHPTQAYMDALPIKMFEYMSASIPVIASNFPRWREIVEGNGCGLCVDPLDPAAIAVAIDRLIENPALARDMGVNGNKAIHQRYNWEAEERKLLSLYEQILAKPAR